MADNVHISLDVFGDQQLDRTLLRFEQRARNFRPVFELLASRFLKINRGQFSSQGGRGSGGWKPLAASTVARKKAQKLDPRILHATLALRKSLTILGTPGQVRVITDDTLTLGTSVKSKKGYPYPAVHQHGSKDGRIPQRRPVEFTDADRKEWVNELQRFLVGSDRSHDYEVSRGRA